MDNKLGSIVHCLILHKDRYLTRGREVARLVDNDDADRIGPVTDGSAGERA